MQSSGRSSGVERNLAKVSERIFLNKINARWYADRYIIGMTFTLCTQILVPCTKR